MTPPEIERPRSVGVRELDSAVERGAAPVRPASHEGRVGEGRAGEVPERPRLKLLPRSKPIEAPEPSPTYVEEKQVVTICSFHACVDQIANLFAMPFINSNNQKYSVWLLDIPLCKCYMIVCINLCLIWFRYFCNLVNWYGSFHKDTGNLIVFPLVMWMIV